MKVVQEEKGKRKEDEEKALLASTLLDDSLALGKGSIKRILRSLSCSAFLSLAHTLFFSFSPPRSFALDLYLYIFILSNGMSMAVMNHISYFTIQLSVTISQQFP